MTERYIHDCSDCPDRVFDLGVINEVQCYATKSHRRIPTQCNWKKPPDWCPRFKEHRAKITELATRTALNGEAGEI